MYQLPVRDNVKAQSDGGRLRTHAHSLDLDDLNERLHTLGLDGQPQDSSGTAHPPELYRQLSLDRSFGASHLPSRDSLAVAEPAANLKPPAGHPWITGQEAPVQTKQDHTDIDPGDSISMYRPSRAPSRTVGSRRGGTNVDPGENAHSASLFDEAAPHDGASFWSGDEITHRTPATGVAAWEDEMTPAPTSVWTRNDLGYDMYDHRDRMTRQESQRDNQRMNSIQQQLNETRDLATTATKLEMAEKQLRELQAKLIAEQVARTQIEREADLRDEEMKNYQTEWASAVRALRRARDEGKKSDEEKRRILRCFEEARDKLWKYHEALRVREARAQGREEGRAEAWQEAERWMGGSPPIPGIEPLQSVPEAVLRQTPMLQPLSPGPLRSPKDQHLERGSQSPPAQQWVQQGQQVGVQPSMAQVMEFITHNLAAFPAQQQQPSIPQHTPTAQKAFSQTGPSQANQQAHHGAVPMQAESLPYVDQRPAPLASAMPSMLSHQHQQSFAPPTNIDQHLSHPVGAHLPSHHPATNAPGSPYIGSFPHDMKSSVGGAAIKMPQAGPPVAAHSPSRTVAAQTVPFRPMPLPSHGPQTGVSSIPHIPRPRSLTPPAQIGQSYLDRVDHDPALKRMMIGARDKTLHSSAVLPTESSRPPSRVKASQGDESRGEHAEGVKQTDKPLPNPFSTGTRGLTRARTQYAPSPQSSAINQRNMTRRLSLSDGLNHSHAKRNAQIPDGDRYPAFPMGGNTGLRPGRGHSRQTSLGSIDPAAVDLPESRDASAYRTSGRGPAARSSYSAARSRMAGALRNDTDMDEELSGIDEAQEVDSYSQNLPLEQQGHHGQMQEHPGHQPLDSRSFSRGMPRPPPSMPSMRQRIRPVMPQPLGAATPQGPGKPFSEPRAGDCGSMNHDRGHRPHRSLSALFHRRDPVALQNQEMPPPRSTYHAPKTHEMFVPPQLAPMAVSGGVEGVAGPRHSALGLSGLDSDDSGDDVRGGRMKAPTSTRSKSDHPGSTYDGPSPVMTMHPGEKQPLVQGVPRVGRQRINLDTPPQPSTTRQMIIVTERSGTPDAHRVPLPPPRSVAPTAYSAVQSSEGEVPSYMEPARSAGIGHTARQAQAIPLPQSRAGGTTYSSVALGHAAQASADLRKGSKTQTATEADQAGKGQGESATHTNKARDVPLPPSRSMAPTAYTASPSPKKESGAGRVSANEAAALPSMFNADTAKDVPLPRGDGTNYDRKTTVAADSDVNDPFGDLHSPQSAANVTEPHAIMHNALCKAMTHGNRKQPTGAGRIDPRQIPLPTSQVPTVWGRASTYAASVAPIEEVTESESGRDSMRRRKGGGVV
ncbi:hypothetical protein IAU60_002291 [Kwoniella sp. DSM 27419]